MLNLVIIGVIIFVIVLKILDIIENWKSYLIWGTILSAAVGIPILIIFLPYLIWHKLWMTEIAMVILFVIIVIGIGSFIYGAYTDTSNESDIDEDDIDSDI